jgi:hypothetical protein
MNEVAGAPVAVRVPVALPPCFCNRGQVVESASVSVTPRIIPRSTCIIVTMAHIRALLFRDRVSRPLHPAPGVACHGLVLRAQRQLKAFARCRVQVTGTPACLSACAPTSGDPVSPPRAKHAAGCRCQVRGRLGRHACRSSRRWVGGWCVCVCLCVCVGGGGARGERLQVRNAHFWDLRVPAR